MTDRTFVRWVLIAACVVFSAGACGDDGAASTRGDVPAPASVSMPTETSISVPVTPSSNAPELCAETEGEARPYGPTLLAFDAATGARRWSVCAPTPSEYLVVGATDAVVLVVGYSFAGVWEVAAFDVTSGAVRWRWPSEADPPQVRVIVDGSSVYITGVDGVTKLDASTGTERWHVAVTGTVYARNGNLFVVQQGRTDPDASATLRAFDPESGATRWVVDVESSYAFAYVGADTVAVMVSDRNFRGTSAIVVDASTGDELWRAPALSGVGVIGDVVLVSEQGNGGVDLVGRDVQRGEVMWRRKADLNVSIGRDNSPVAWEQYAIGAQLVDGSVISGVVDVQTGRFVQWGRSAPPFQPQQAKAFLVAALIGADVAMVELMTGVPIWQAQALPPEVVSGAASGYLTGATLAGDAVVVAASNNTGA